MSHRPFPFTDSWAGSDLWVAGEGWPKVLVIGDHLYKTVKHLSVEYCHRLCLHTVKKVKWDQVG